jgi:hypothetical protein
MKQAIRALTDRVKRAEQWRHPPRVITAIMQLGEDTDLVTKDADPHDTAIVHCIVSGVPRAGDEPGPRPELCTERSLREAMGEVKQLLARWGPSENARKVAAHWASLLERFGIEDTDHFLRLYDVSLAELNSYIAGKR